MIAVQRDERRDCLRRCLHPLAACVEAGGRFGLGVAFGRIRLVFERRHQRRRVGDRGRLGLRRLRLGGLSGRRLGRCRRGRDCGFGRCRGLDRRRLDLGCSARFRLHGALSVRLAPCAAAIVAGGDSARPSPPRLRFRGHGFRNNRRVGRGLGAAGEPGRPATGATHCAAGRADRGLVDHVGGGTVRTDDQHVIGAGLGRKPSRRPLMDWKPCPPRRTQGIGRL